MKKGLVKQMLYFARMIATLIIPIIMYSNAVTMVSATPREAVTDFMEGLHAQKTWVMEKYMDNAYVNFLNNVQGDEAVTDRMNNALFQDFSYQIEEIASKNDVAVAKIIIRNHDFSGVLNGYNAASYQYVMSNLYTEEIADKNALNAVCLELYVQQIESAAAGDAMVETVVFVPMVDDGYYGWNIVMTDELMLAVLGNLQPPVL